MSKDDLECIIAKKLEESPNLPLYAKDNTVFGTGWIQKRNDSRAL
jgi:hypothetical protein